ncbi:MAG: hypothetical protein A2268_03105 [Candidatus Raymondbacteria bacterium RifOxyA12_full_50_37]|uniref:DUF2007 domain-containing protein n=1 Tax=Candidatus Raymondbacteria bacterium RIFOXYD12_FULL_49_13 TaxID=1817890 RepID=A0A1F7F9D2_UNCRA|nr:MAG: hypothetical protein A2248_17215 [Candidatus Raymondbacteria bacterium RIFOXYA2_FULL_49_16]OGJ90765.1 MAG: hypothetical protein A2268_03105 [Candidatus Raymondbacteria bacterium RifOxyA12_full_50_37]OGJ92956.1 MAG: hypothetical protein A2350_04970 [Candidatus Raymondbacteria bacterium RifOxyB12_full_50_8]OGJ98402.1 MAG: hypothetical protein A2453_09115 [Candidatus Raymondbacteria bacterium RIFOXYC2_FULL_50_21]OGK02652.1 MAG: hypothetical protein A2487_08750 [Candidatus Raymondbacteria b
MRQNAVRRKIMDNIEYVEILKTNSMTDLSMINMILSDAKIEYYIENETTLFILPPMALPRVMVLKEQSDEAIMLLKTYDL